MRRKKGRGYGLGALASGGDGGVDNDEADGGEIEVWSGGKQS